MPKLTSRPAAAILLTLAVVKYKRIAGCSHEANNTEAYIHATIAPEFCHHDYVCVPVVLIPVKFGLKLTEWSMKRLTLTRTTSRFVRCWLLAHC